jgi:hypothetical protein
MNFGPHLPSPTRFFLFFAIVLVLLFLISPAWSGTAPLSRHLDWKRTYIRTGLDEHLEYDIFAKAMEGLQRWDFSKPHLLTIIDFTRPSYEKRCYVLDLKRQDLLYRTYVAHGRNTGMTYARQFSNTPNSYQSSLGFFRTGETYRGKRGYSLRLDGLEEAINDLARKRGIVMHGADYAGKSFLNKNGRLGRSLGCPSLPPTIHARIIRRIKEGSCLFVYAEDSGYLSSSTVFASPSG